MRSIRLLGLDLKRGIRENPVLFLVPVVLAAVFCGEIYRNVHLIRTVTGSQEVALGDFLFFTYAGMHRNPVIFPIRWTMVLGAVALGVLNWPVADMHGIGQYVMVHANGRRKWWLSKCVWNMTATFCYHLLMILTFLFVCIVGRFSVSRDIHMELLSTLMGISAECMEMGREELPLLICIAPIVFSMALNMIQMTMSLFVKPVYSYLVVLGILIVSWYKTSPYVIGNYGMILRYDWIEEMGVSASLGIWISAGIILCSVLIGMWKMYHLDILKEEQAER